MNWKQFTTATDDYEAGVGLWIINKVNELKAIHNGAWRLKEGLSTVNH